MCTFRHILSVNNRSIFLIYMYHICTRVKAQLLVQNSAKKGGGLFKYSWCSHFFAQGQQVDNVVEGITWEHQLQDYYDCAHFWLPSQLCRDSHHCSARVTNPPHEKEEIQGWFTNKQKLIHLKMSFSNLSVGEHGISRWQEVIQNA